MNVFIGIHLFEKEKTISMIIAQVKVNVDS